VQTNVFEFATLPIQPASGNGGRRGLWRERTLPLVLQAAGQALRLAARFGRVCFCVGTVQNTSISLLTRDGGICATFKPGLNADQYAALAAAIEHDGDTAVELAELLRKLARSWGCEVIIDPC
jgi:hypothetical protein